MMKAQRGDVIEIDMLGSWSTAQTVAREFGEVGLYNYGVLLENVGPMKRLNVSPIMHFLEKEALSFGKFEVLRTTQQLKSRHSSKTYIGPEPYQHIYVRQILDDSWLDIGGQ